MWRFFLYLLGSSFSLVQLLLLVDQWGSALTSFGILHLIICPVGFVGGLLMLFRRKIGHVLVCLVASVEFVEAILRLLILIPFFLFALMGGGDRVLDEWIWYSLKYVLLLVYLVPATLIAVLDYKWRFETSDDPYVFRIG